MLAHPSPVGAFSCHDHGMEMTRWSGGEIEARTEAVRRRPEPEHETGTWWRDYMRDGWVNGTLCICDETIATFPRDRVQAFARRVTGAPLPPEAFPPPVPAVVAVVDAAEKMGLLSRPHGMP